MSSQSHLSKLEGQLRAMMQEWAPVPESVLRHEVGAQLVPHAAPLFETLVQKGHNDQALAAISAGLCIATNNGQISARPRPMHAPHCKLCCPRFSKGVHAHVQAAQEREKVLVHAITVLQRQCRALSALALAEQRLEDLMLLGRGEDKTVLQARLSVLQLRSTVNPVITPHTPMLAQQWEALKTALVLDGLSSHTVIQLLQGMGKLDCDPETDGQMSVVKVAQEARQEAQLIVASLEAAQSQQRAH